MDVRGNQTVKVPYVNALEKDKWLNAESKGKRRTRIGKKKIPELKSVSEVNIREVYVQELNYSSCNTAAEFENMVIEYCR